jgi:hypothetical protein
VTVFTPEQQARLRGMRRPLWLPEAPVLRRIRQLAEHRGRRLAPPEDEVRDVWLARPGYRRDLAFAIADRLANEADPQPLALSETQRLSLASMIYIELFAMSDAQREEPRSVFERRCLAEWLASGGGAEAAAASSGPLEETAQAQPGRLGPFARRDPGTPAPAFRVP